MALEPGMMLWSYQVTALIGEGGIGQVYQATDTKLTWFVFYQRHCHPEIKEGS